MTGEPEPPHGPAVPMPGGTREDDLPPPKRQRGRDDPPSGDDPSPPEDDLDRAAELFHDNVLSAGRDVNAGDIDNRTILVENYFEGSDTKDKRFVSWVLITADVEDAQASFVVPPHFPELTRRLREDRVVVLSGSGCGTRSAAHAALHECCGGPIAALPASVSATALLAALERIYRKHPTAGVLIRSIDGETLRGLAGFDLLRLRQALAGRGALVMTTRTPEGQSVLAPGLSIIQGVPPDPEAVLRSTARVRGLSEENLVRAQAALGMLPPPVTPARAAKLVDLSQTQHELSAEELAALVAWDRTPLDQWVAERPTAPHVASLTAAAVLHGAPSTDVETQAKRLEHALEGEIEPPSEPRRFGVPDRGWPAGVVRITRDTFSTHFGRRGSEIIELCPSHPRDRVVGFLWDSLGADFRGPYLDWLRSLPDHGGERVQLGAAITAGALFVAEPLIAERELLRPWASDGRRPQISCAGLALGAPVYFGEDPAPARALAYHWVRSDNLRHCRVAIAAYGGLLGAWDSGSAAPVHLWRVGMEKPVLRRMADLSLALLVAAGQQAGWARAMAINVFAGEAEERPERRRSYELLPLVMGQLASGRTNARESFAALLDESERESLALLAALFARAFDAPMGHVSARAALRCLLDGLAENRIDRRMVNQLIRAMKAVTRPGRLAALGSQIERTLNAERRGDGPRAQVADSVHATFYSPPPRRSLA